MPVNRRTPLRVLLALALQPALLSAQTVHGRSGRTHVVGVLSIGSKRDFAPDLAVFQAALAQEGYREGRNLRFEVRYADYDFHKIARLAADLVRARVDLIFAPESWAVQGAQSATDRIPIVFAFVNDPVGQRFVQSLARPGGNITGVSIANADLTAKRMQLMRELFPDAAQLGIVYDQDAAKACVIELEDIEAAGRQLGVAVVSLPYSRKAELVAAFSRGRGLDVPAVLVPTTMETRRLGGELVAQSVLNRIPTVHSSRIPVDAGGLMSYGPSFAWATRRAAHYVARILAGARPSDLAVEQPARFELVINLKTAHAMGITIPPSVLLRADEVIR